MSTIIKNGTIITAGETYKADILIEREKITHIGLDLPQGNAELVDASGMYVMPGGIDVHTHLDLPFFGTVASDDHYTGHRGAAFGATTSHIDFVIQPQGGTLRDGLDVWRGKVEDKTVIDYGFHMAITDLHPDVMEEIPSLLDEGIASIKLFLAYKGLFQIDDTTLFNAMTLAAEHGMLTMVHAENGDVVDILTKRAIAEGKRDPVYHALTRPALAEAEATWRAVALAGMANAPLYVVHMTCAGAVNALRNGRELGLPVMGETCVQYFFFSIKDLERPNFEGSKFVCSPPMRTEEDQEALWKAIARNDLQAVSTDHCPFFFDGTRPIEYEGEQVKIPGKELGKGDFSKIPNGMHGIEDRMLIMWSYGVNKGRISPNRFVEITATNPAKIFGLYPRKGAIAVGADADIAIWDPEKKHVMSAKTHHMRTDHNVYEGWELTGMPIKVYRRGELLVDGEQWLGKRGTGQYLPRQPHAQLI